MLNNNFQKILINFGIWLGMSIILFLIGVSKSYALMTTDDVSFLGHTINGTWSTSPNGSNSGTTWIIADKPTSYIYIDICSTGETGMTIVNINNSQGNVSYMGSNHMGIRCNVGNSSPELTRHYLKVNNWNQLSSSFDEWNVNFTMTYKSNVSWNVNNLLYSVALGDTGPWTETQDIIDNANANTQDIINNQNQNNQNIINNQNQNTQNIINNQNTNTNKEIESQQVCEYIDNKDIITNGYLYNNGGIGTDITSSGVTDYFKIDDHTIIKKLVSADDDAYYRLCFYNTNKTFISCVTKNEYNNLENISIPSSASYVRFTINKTTNKPQFQICKNGNQALNDSINGLNDSINDDDSSGATSEASDFFSDFTTNTFGLTSIITAPLNLIQSLTSSTCTQLHLPLPYLDNKYLDLPCMTSIYQQYFGSFFTMYQTITYGIIAYWVIVRIFNQVKDFKNPEHDEIEVVDL